jgi:DNA repair protein RecO (recombination protein O)
LGYGLDFGFEVDGMPINEDLHYEFNEHQGFSKNSNGSVHGKTLLNLSKRETITDAIELSILKKMNRKRLKSLLGDKPLKSKELFFMK